MYLLRGARQATPVARQSAPSFLRRPLTTTTARSFAYQKTEVNGARPKILNENPPDEQNAPQEVKEHNKEVDRRADRPQEKVKNEDVEKDKVPKGYWGGSQAGENKESG